MNWVENEEAKSWSIFLRMGPRIGREVFVQRENEIRSLLRGIKRRRIGHGRGTLKKLRLHYEP